ncbi:MAG: response regulator, partial [Campylobacterales bacterium]
MAHRPQLVITDIQMPLMNGLEMAKAIRAIDPETMIAVTTAYSDEEYFMESIGVGVSHYILKPIHRDKLLDAVGHMVERINERERLKEYEAKELKEKISRVSTYILDAVSDALPIPSILFTEDNRLLFANQAFATMVDLSRLRAIEAGKMRLDDLL